MKVSTVAALSGVLVIGTFLLQFVLLWTALSLVTSGVKAVKDQCGQTYRIEKVLSGNWFCPK